MYLRPRRLRCCSHVLVFRSVGFKQVCPGCRSVRRIRDLFAGGFLLRSQEAKAVEVLRCCIGALTDLAEIAAPLLERKRAESGPPAVVEPRGIGPSGPLGLPEAPVVGR